MPNWSTTELMSMEMKTQLTKSKKFTTFLQMRQTHLIRFFLYLISRIFLTKKENYQYSNRNSTQMVQYSMRLTIFQMVRMMIVGITGAFITGVQSGSLTLPSLNMQTQNSCNLHSQLRGVHPKELLKSCVRSIQTYHSLVSMMSQDVRLQGIIRTV